MPGLVATPFITISKSISSHRSAQGMIYADQLRQAGVDITVNATGELYHNDFNEFKELYVYHGNDWSGNINLFGGLKGFPYITNFVNFTKFKGQVFSIAIDMPDYYGMMKEKFDKAKEKQQEWDEKWNDIDWNNLERMCKTAKTIIPNSLVEYPKLSVGDSHAICMYRPGWQNISVPFKTLHGALSQKLTSFIKDAEDGYSEIEFYFGNIDVRHHLLRQDDPISATKELVKEYVDQAHVIAYKYQCQVRLYELLPIENESRPIPKTGWYKGTPFYGSWSERNEIRKLFREEIKRLTKGSAVVKLYEWVGAMINSSGELDFKYMEKPQSVHLSREYYPHWQGWEYSNETSRKYEPRPETELNTLDAFF